MRRRPLLLAAWPWAILAQPALRRLVVLDCELQDDHENPDTVAAQTVRLRNATQQLKRELAEAKLYDVVELGAAQPLLRQLQGQVQFVYRCDDCADQVGKAAGAALVMTPWVQKVSELILNFNVQIWDTAAGRVVFTKSVDLRGNQDTSWTRAVHYLVRDMAEKRAGNPRYGT